MGTLYMWYKISINLIKSRSKKNYQLFLQFVAIPGKIVWIRGGHHPQTESAQR